MPKRLPVVSNFSASLASFSGSSCGSQSPSSANAPKAVVPPAQLPTVVALEALWQEVRARPLWAPPHFFRYLALRWRTRLRMLDPTRVKILAPPGKVNDCSGCMDICCIGPRSTVLLRFRDIATLMDIGRTDLMTHDKPHFGPEELAQRPALARQVSSRSWATFPVLRQNRFAACAALTDDGKCSIYPYWPLACARFPYALHADDDTVFYSARCDSFWVRRDGTERVASMAVDAVVSYNERIKDLVLLAYAPERLAELGLLQHIKCA